MKRNTHGDVRRIMEGTSTQVIDLLPGDVWEVGRATIRREHDSIGPPEIARYEQYFAEQHPVNEDLTDADLAAYLERLNRVPEIATCENLIVRMIGVGSSANDVDVSFAITNGHLAQLAKTPERPNLKMTMPLAIMNAVIKQDLSWDEAFIGYWCEFERHPNVYHAGFWRLFQAPYYQKRIPAGETVSGTTVSRQSTVAELLETYGSDADRVLRRYGLYCRGCQHSTAESLELAARQHGVEERRVETMILELNRSIARHAGDADHT